MDRVLIMAVLFMSDSGVSEVIISYALMPKSRNPNTKGQIPTKSKQEITEISARMKLINESELSNRDMLQI